MSMATYVVSLDWDLEASKWYALNDEISIMLEDYSLDALIRRVKLAAPELLELNGASDAATASLFFKYGEVSKVLDICSGKAGLPCH